jgi:acetyltransferase (GNAT) family protein
MTVTERDLIDAIESTLHFYPPVAGLVDALDVPGVKGRVSRSSHPVANLVGMARLDAANANATIERVKGVYRKRGLAFGWITGPNSTPRDLEQRLSAAGLHREDRIAGMAVTDLDMPIDPNPRVVIREVASDEALARNDMMARAYGLPPDVNELFVRLLAAKNGIRARTYFASLGEGEPIAWSYLVYVPDSPMVLLGGAATLPDARGHGAYTALVKRRLDDARADGREAAVIQADRNTSAPICAKLGFKELCSLEMFVWSPPA